jgi:SAM-dependent methyltransferase
MNKMCNQTVVAWFANLAKNNPEQFANKRIIEVGSKDFNGSVRSVLNEFGRPLSYLGVDVSSGKNVDEIVPAEKLVEKFGDNAFDIVISTEMIEHVFDWKIVIDNLKKILKPNGTIFLTTRSFGFQYHGYPFDFWRYEPEDMKFIFKDFEIEYLHYDDETYGVLLKAKKPIAWQPIELKYNLYSIALGKKSLFPSQISFTRKALILLQSFLAKAVQPSTNWSAKNNRQKLTLRTERPIKKKIRILLIRSRLMI